MQFEPSRPQFARALDTLRAGDTLVITTLDRLGRSTQNILFAAQELQTRGATLRVLNLGGDTVDTSTPTGSVLFTTLAALAKLEHDIKRARILDSISQRRQAGKNLGGRPRLFSDSHIRSAVRLVEAGKPAAEVAYDLGMSRATFYRRSRGLID